MALVALSRAVLAAPFSVSAVVVLDEMMANPCHHGISLDLIHGPIRAPVDNLLGSVEEALFIPLTA